MERIAASLVYDTQAQPLASGIRAMVQRGRRLLYAAEETEVVLQISPAKQAGQVALMGQVLDDGLPVEQAAVTLRGPVGEIHKVTDDDGEFLIGHLPPGSYDLEVAQSFRSISVASLDLA